MIKTELKTLENGLTLVMCQDKTRHSVYAEIITKFGGMTKDYIKDGKEYHLMDGIAHLLEHALIDGATEGNLLDYYSKNYVSFNGFTTKNETSFFIDVVKDFSSHLEKLLKAVNTPSFTEETLEVTKNPIYDEIRKHDDKRFKNFNEAYDEMLLKNTNYKNNLGTIEDIRNITYEEVRRCHDLFYQPKNQMLIISGNFDIDEIVELVNNVYNSFNKEYEEFTYIKLNEEKTFEEKERTIIDNNEEEMVNITYKVDISSLEPHDSLMLSFYLWYFLRFNFDDTSVLFQEMIDKKYSIFSIDTQLSKIENYLYIDIASYTKEKNYFINRVNKILQNRGYIDPEKFELLKKRGLVTQIMKEENCNAVLKLLVGNITDHNYYEPDTIEDINSLNIEDYKKFMENLDFSNYFVIVQKKED